MLSQGQLLVDQWQGGLVGHDHGRGVVQRLVLGCDHVVGLVCQERGGQRHSCDHFEGLYGP